MRYIVIKENKIVDVLEEEVSIELMRMNGVDCDLILSDKTDHYEIGFDFLQDEYEALDKTDHYEKEEERISELWQRATAYEQKYISGSMYTVLAVLIESKNIKSLEVSAWVRSIWDLYYQEKYKIRNEDGYNSLEDFSVCGDCPHSVPELINEFDKLG